MAALLIYKEEDMSKTLKSPITIRGDMLYCPLCLTIDSYWNCLVDCHHCYMRRLNRTWGQELRPADPETVYKKLKSGLRNIHPKTSLAVALSLKKTIRLGNKTDPYQPIESTLAITRRILKVLIKLNWSFVIQTRFVNNLQDDEDLLSKAHRRGLLTIMPVISPGGDWDQEVLERGKTPILSERLRIIARWVRKGWNVGVNGEPFIPGIHTFDQFQYIIQCLRGIGVQSYNTYNLHFNDYVAKRLATIGLDIERIWEMNQDKNWQRIQHQLCEIAKKEGIILGCPDFVNTGPKWIEKANTCCGIQVPRPSTFNTHRWKELLQCGYTFQEVFDETWEGIGDPKLAKRIITGQPCRMYTMKDAGVIK